jgi:hypothetical protein
MEHGKDLVRLAADQLADERTGWRRTAFRVRDEHEEEVLKLMAEAARLAGWR